MKIYRVEKLKHNKSGQALLEVSLLMSLFMFLLGVILRTGLVMSSRQELMMTSFRHAVQMASTDEVAVNTINYAAKYFKDLPVYDPSSPGAVGDLTEIMVQAGAKRTFFDNAPPTGKRRSQPRENYWVNDDLIVNPVDRQRCAEVYSDDICGTFFDLDPLEISNDCVSTDPDHVSIGIDVCNDLKSRFVGHGFTTSGTFSELPLPVYPGNWPNPPGVDVHGRDVRPYLIIKQINDKKDNWGTGAALGEGDDIYWTWAAFLIERWQNLEDDDGNQLPRDEVRGRAGLSYLFCVDPDNETDNNASHMPPSASIEKHGSTSSIIARYAIGRDINPALGSGSELSSWISSWQLIEEPEEIEDFFLGGDMADSTKVQPILQRGGQIFVAWREYLDGQTDICSGSNRPSGDSFEDCQDEFMEAGGTVTIMQIYPDHEAQRTNRCSGSTYFGSGNYYGGNESGAYHGYAYITGFDGTSSLWGDINTNKKSKVPTQGLVEYELVTDVSSNSLTTTIEDGSYSESTDMNTRDVVTRRVVTNPYSHSGSDSFDDYEEGENVRVRSTRNVDATVTNW